MRLSSCLFPCFNFWAPSCSCSESSWFVNVNFTQARYTIIILCQTLQTIALHVLLLVVTKFVYNIWYRHPPDSAGVDEVCPGAAAEELPDDECEGGEEACIVLYCTALYCTVLYCTEHDGEDGPVLPRQRGQPAPAAALSHPLRWRWRGVQTSANWTCIVSVFVWPTKICASFS